MRNSSAFESFNATKILMYFANTFLFFFLFFKKNCPKVSFEVAFQLLFSYIYGIKL